MRTPKTTSPGYVGDLGPARRTWREAAIQAWAHPAEWSPWQLAALVALVALLALAAFWVTRPGGLIGGAEPLAASAAYASAADGRYVYRLLEPVGSRARILATLQAIYDAHKGTAADRSMSIVLLRRAAPVAPFVTGTSQTAGEDVLARVTVTADQREAAVRPGDGTPLQPAALDW
jgi:hypothetical protein